MAAANLANMRQGERTDVEPSANLQKVSQETAAELLQVSPRSVAAAAKVKRTAPAEVVEAKSPALTENLGSSFGVSVLSRELERWLHRHWLHRKLHKNGV